MRKTILAVGAAGQFAGLVVVALSERGARVRGLVRNAEQGNEAQRLGAAEVVIGDLRDLRSVDAALAGVDAVFYIAPAFLPDEAEVGERFVDAVVRSGARRIVFSSVIHPVLAELVNHAAKAPVEAAILDSGLEYALLHPALYFQNYARAWPTVVESGVLAEPWSAESRFSRVDYRDVADVAAIALLEDRLLCGTFELCADGELNREDVAGLIADVTRREIRAVRIDADTLGDEANAMRPMFAHYDHHGLVGSSLTLRAILGREPRTLRAYFEELARKMTHVFPSSVGTLEAGRLVPEESPDEAVQRVLKIVRETQRQSKESNMNDIAKTSPRATQTVPPDDPTRNLSIVNPDDPALRHVSVVGDTYTILLSGAETAGRYCLIDMNVPHCGGPGPHRHDFEEMFTLLEGELQFTFRGEKRTVTAGVTVNIPANALHFFTNVSGKPSRVLCMCAPAGQEDFFLAIGKAVESRTKLAPKPTGEEMAAFLKRAVEVAPKYRTELLKP